MFAAKNVHFHAPSEHQINGKIADLEMHVVHKIEDGLAPQKPFIDDETGFRNKVTKLNGPKSLQSQFGAGVLGVLFNVVPDSYFDTHSDAADVLLQKVALDKKAGAGKLDLFELIG